MLRSRVALLFFMLALLFGGAWQAARAQQPQPDSASAEETVRVRHRVVFLDALVRDKRTRNMIPDLKQDNFEVLADGKPRELAYFTRDGDTGRKPLALVLVLDLRRDGAGRYLRRTEILEAMAAELSKLPPQDEVAVLALEAGGDGDKREWLARFTRNRAQIASALSVVPTLVAEGSSNGESGAQPVNDNDDNNKKTANKDEHRGHSISITIGGDSDKKKKEKEAEKAAAGKSPEDEKAREENDRKEQASVSPGVAVNESGIESQATVTGKNGDTVTRTVYKNGQVRTKRVSKSGTTEIDINDEFGLAAGTREATKVASEERPHSQAAIVWISDGIAPVFYAERDASVAELTKANITFSALVSDMKFGFKLFKPVLKPLGNWVGLSIYGSAQHIAKETGGEAVRVNRPADYATGLAKIIGNLTSRYSLGFKLAEDERDDGQMHQLQVRVKAARDAKGKERKLEVVSRKGFYLPKEKETAQTATTPE